MQGVGWGSGALPMLMGAVDWVRKGSYHTAWAVPCGSSCSCSYAYGRGPAVGPHTGEWCWPLLADVWRTIALLMKFWCAEGDVLTAANLNLYWKRSSSVVWHSDYEPLFGERGDAKVIVSTQALKNGRASPVWTVVLARATLVMVTFLSWMSNVRTSFFTVRIPVWRAD